jgi:hypothetical protein
VFYSPASICALPSSTSPVYAAQNQGLVNIVAPNVQADLFDRNFNDPSRQNATFYLAPGERASITLRAYCVIGSENCDRLSMAALEGSTAMSVIAQGANCVRCVGLGCSLSDAVGGGTECMVDDGPPKDVYDPVPPSLALFEPSTTPSATDVDNDGVEPVSFTLSATDNLALSSVTCSTDDGAIEGSSGSPGYYSFSAAFPVGSTPVTCTAADSRSQPGPNTASVTFDVVVFEVPAPTLGDPPFTFPVPSGANGWYRSPIVTGQLNATSTASFSVACIDSLQGTAVSGTTISVSGDGRHQIVCIAGSTATASVSASAAVNIDTTAPVVTSPGTQVFAATSANGAVVSYAPVTAVDALTPVTIACAPQSGTLFAIGTTAVTCTARDEAGNAATASFSVTVRDTIAPASITVSSVTPPILWPPDGRTVNVTVAGTAFDAQSGVAQIAWRVIDEYGSYQPSAVVGVSGNGPFTLTVPLIAARKGSDKDGRHYTIVLTAVDAAGNRTAMPLAQSPVVNVHDQSTP